MAERISIIPFGSVKADIIIEVESYVGLTFGKTVIINRPLQPYKEAYNTQRNQYSAQKFLNHPEINTEGGMRVLCITDVDLYLPDLNYVFGFADESRCIAVVSTSRLKKGNEKVIERVIKTSIHELGHTYGLQHCNNQKCVMFFSYTVSDTDYKGKDFCIKCQRKLENNLNSFTGVVS